MQTIKSIIFIVCTLQIIPVFPAPMHKKYRTFIDYFHSLKCLTTSAYFLSRLNEHNYCYNPCNCIDQNTCVQMDSIPFFDQTITSCIQKMRSTNSIKPMLTLLSEMQNNYTYHNNQFFHELFLLIFTVHKQILMQECEGAEYNLKKTSLATIIEIGEKINQLPLAELLSAIDMLMTELPPFLEKYEFNSTISWKKWLKKYWWVPPVMGGWFVLRILLSFQRSHYYFSSYRPPRPTIQTNYPHQITSNDPAWDEICRNEARNKPPKNS